VSVAFVVTNTFYRFFFRFVFFLSSSSAAVGVVRGPRGNPRRWYDGCGARAVAYDKKPVPRRDFDAARQRERWWSAVMCAANEPCCCRRTCGWVSCCGAPRPRCRPAELPRCRTSTTNEVRWPFLRRLSRSFCRRSRAATVRSRGFSSTRVWSRLVVGRILPALGRPRWRRARRVSFIRVKYFKI